jgi:hypothetical protein
MKKLLSFLKNVFQLGFVIGSAAFLYYGYVHLEGNTRFINAIQTTRNSMEGRAIAGRLKPLFKDLEKIHPLAAPANFSGRFFQIKEKGKGPLIVAHIQRDLQCASCKALDFVLITDYKAVIQRVLLWQPLDVEGKAVNAMDYLKQFEGKSFEGRITVGKEVEGIKEAPVYGQALTEAISDTLEAIKKGMLKQ